MDKKGQRMHCEDNDLLIPSFDMLHNNNQHSDCQHLDDNVLLAITEG
jgi:hypothetical protein